jgi:hypothetical protein
MEFKQFSHPEFIHQLIQHKWNMHSVCNDAWSIFINELNGDGGAFIEYLYPKYKGNPSAVKSFSLSYDADGHWHLSIKTIDGGGQSGKVYHGDIVQHPILAEMHEHFTKLQTYRPCY